MSTPNSLSVLDNLQIAMLTDWNDVSRVRKISKGCQFMQDVEQLNIGFGTINSKSLDTLEYRESYIGDDELVAEIQATAVIGNTLVIDLQPINGQPVEFFRDGSVVFGDREQIQGIVVSNSPGQIVIEPSGDGVTIQQLNSSFIVGGDVNYLGIYKQYRNSSGVNGLNRVPEIQMNYLSLMREGAAWNRVDMHKARVSFQDGFWVNGQVTSNLDRMLKAIERSWFWGIPEAPNNDFSRNGGVDWAIRQRGGTVYQFAGLPTEDEFNDWLKQCFYKRPGYIRLKKLYMGNALYMHINRFFSTNYITQIVQTDPMSARTGERNENINMYKVGGFEVELVTNLTMFQELDYRKQPTTLAGLTGMRKEWSCYLIDQDPIEIDGGGTVPAIEKLHWGESPFYIGRSTGIGDCPVGMPTADGQLGNPEMYMVSTSALDRSEIHFMYHGGVNMITGEFSGVFEPAA